MRTAISIDEALLTEADDIAREMGLSRSGLFARAMRDFLRQRRQESMLRRLNEVYKDTSEPAEKELLKKVKVRFSRTLKDRW